ncbi:uncharacterized protein LOC113360551 [Papaver somniferum]|uniref:uncharacterized protein LOC113360551 n=1 Tax=Papaver somniferum TaxID=3469 RepID=UPI000E6F9CF9|nr:uncharacterized protein LOC113360551 [Papaver somniferum]
MAPQMGDLEERKGFEVVQGGTVVSHLQFADNTLVFLQPHSSQISHLRNVLLWFDIISGLTVNFKKTSIIPVGNVPQVNSLARSFGYRIDNFPFPYLGLPLGDSYMSKAKWDIVIERVEARLNSSSAIYLSRGRKLVIIHDVLQALPVYLMSLFVASVSVIEKLE